MNKEELQKLRVADLVAICNEHGIQHYHGKNCYKKDELIEAILSFMSDVKKNVCQEETQDAAQTDKFVEDQKLAYIETSPLKSIVAFRTPNGKVKSAKIIKRSSTRKQLMLETSYGKQYVIPYSDVIWVRSGKKWPCGVYRLLKGLDADGERGQRKAGV